MNNESEMLSHDKSIPLVRPIGENDAKHTEMKLLNVEGNTNEQVESQLENDTMVKPVVDGTRETNATSSLNEKTATGIMDEAEQTKQQQQGDDGK